MRHRVVLSLVGVALAVVAGLAAGPATTNATTKPAEKKTTASGLTIIYTQAGDGGAKPNDVVSVLYTGKFQDGTVFDSTSLKGGEPFDFVLGKQMVIKGWDEGIEGMVVGEKRTLICPPNVAYGPEGRGGVIPPNATLTFEVTLVGLRRPSITQ
jgi:FKBP-type peptidyl-prolyl cis-trans isomerase